MDIRVHVITAALAIAGSAAAEQAPYHSHCCPERDCRPARPGEIIETAAGYFIPALRETVPAGDARVLVSADARFHLCARTRAHPGMAWSQSYALLFHKQVKCLYVPALF